MLTSMLFSSRRLNYLIYLSVYAYNQYLQYNVPLDMKGCICRMADTPFQIQGGKTQV